MNVEIYSVATSKRYLLEYLNNFNDKLSYNQSIIVPGKLKEIIPSNLNLKVIEIKKNDVQDLRILSRHPKFCPHIYFKGPTIYHDTNIKLNKEFLNKTFSEKYFNDNDILTYHHSRRKFIIQEIIYLFFVGKFTLLQTFQAIYIYKKHLFKRLLMGGIIFNKNTENSISISSKIWKEYSKLNLKRDQLVLSKYFYHFKRPKFNPLDENIVSYEAHSEFNNNLKEKSIRKILIKIKNKLK